MKFFANNSIILQFLWKILINFFLGKLQKWSFKNVWKKFEISQLHFFISVLSSIFSQVPLPTYLVASITVEDPEMVSA